MEVAVFLGACLAIAVVTVLMLRAANGHARSEPPTLDTRGPDDR